MKLLTIVILAFAFILLYACTKRAPNVEQQQISDYAEHLQSTPVSSLVDEPAAIFSQLYSDLKSNATESTIRETYAENLYFNDTFRIITQLDELVSYMQETSDNVELTQVKILETIKGKEDYYVRWEMDIKFSVSGRNVHSRSIGMTQLRFDSEGKIVFHQDFWDGVEGFYQHLPLIGYAVRKVRSKL